MAFSDAFLDELRDALPVSQVVGAHIALRREGVEWRAVDDQSLTVNDSKKLWFDHGSRDEGGDIFDWYVKREGMEFRQAVEECAAQAGMPVPKENGKAYSAPRRGPGGAIERDEVPFAPVDGAEAVNPTTNRAKPVREIVKTYDYTDAAGDLLYQVVRLQFRTPSGEWERGKDGRIKKTFAQRRPSGENGIWIWGLGAGEFMRKGPRHDWYQFNEKKFGEWNYSERRRFDQSVEHGLYRLVELREEMADGRAAYIVEGEKDCDTLWDWGLPATTNSGGAKNWRPDHAETFRGMDVVVPVDNDEAGRAHGEAVAKSLRGIAKRVRVLDWRDCWPGAPDKADVTDWRDQAGGTVGRLLEIAAALPTWTPAPYVSKFGALPWERLDEPGVEHEFIIDGWLTVGDKSIIGGPSKSGKSFLAIHAAMAIARCTEFFGQKVMCPGLVIYQAGEGARGIKKRLRAYRKHFDVPWDEHVPFVLLQSKIDLYRDDGDTDALIDEIKALAEQYDVPLRAVFIDTLATATGGADENSGRDMSAVMANVDKINAATGAHVCLVHHMNAAGTKLRGHTSIYANIDQVITVTRDEMTKIRTAVLDKQKDGEDGQLIRFELMSVGIGFRQSDGEPITSCVTLDVGEREAVKSQKPGFKLTQQEELVFRALVTALGELGRPPPADRKNIPPQVSTVVTYKEWRDVYARSAPIDEDSDDAKRAAAVKKAMQRAGVTLLSFGIIGRDNPFCWWSGKPVRGFGPDVKSNVEAK